MIVLFGTKAYIRNLYFLTALCAACGVATQHRVYRRILRLTLFFIPTIPLSIRRFTECPQCGRTIKITAEESERLRPHAVRA